MGEVLMAGDWWPRFWEDVSRKVYLDIIEKIRPTISYFEGH